MTVPDDLERILRLACLTTDRTDAEQAALLRVARGIDNERNANVVTNRRMWGEQAGSLDARQIRPLSGLESMVAETRELVDGQRPVALQRRKNPPGGRADP